MSWFYQKKRIFLIRLLKTLGFGSVIAYSICSCEDAKIRPTEYRARMDVAPDRQQSSDLQGSSDNAAEKKPGENQPAQNPNADTQNTDSTAAPNADSPTDANANPQNAGNAADPNAKPASDNAQNANQARPPKNKPAIRQTEYRARIPDLVREDPKPKKRATKYLALIEPD